MTTPTKVHTDRSQAVQHDIDVSMLTPRDCQCGNAHEAEPEPNNIDERKEQVRVRCCYSHYIGSAKNLLFSACY
uniref:Uncharacterized protein n=1 Tax=Hyaloperonospora arabidopsidis (strain Emoy2) TaxID=559515 RepID=M4BL82_HYAAE